MNRTPPGLLAVLGVLGATSVASAQITIVPYASLTQNFAWDFSGVGAGGGIGSNYDGIVSIPGVSFAERFLGQTLSTIPAPPPVAGGPHDVLGPTVTGALALQVGAASRNINVITFLPGFYVIDGLGPDGFPNTSAIGEGSMAALYTQDYFEIGFGVNTDNAGAAPSFMTIDFFRRDGSSIQRMAVQVAPGNPSQQLFGFRRDGNVADIAGFSVFNDDPGGMGYLNVVPAPGAGIALLLGCAFAARRRRA